MATTLSETMFEISHYFAILDFSQKQELQWKVILQLRSIACSLNVLSIRLYVEEDHLKVFS